MTYLKALELLTRAYKAARGRMPEGLDLLKIKQKARQKVIDAKKVIQFPKDKITPFQKPRPTETEIMMKQTGIPVTVKGKTTTMTPDGILKMLMGKGKGKDVKIGQAPKTTKVKEPVDPKLVQQESIKDMYKRLMKSNREAIKNFKNRNKPRDDKANGGPIDPGYLGIPPAGLGTGSRPGGHPYPSLDYYDDDFGVKGLMKKRKKKKKKRDDKATGGLANLSQTYDNNPTLQSQFPDKQDYLDLFSSTTTTTPQTTTYAQMTQQPAAGITAVKPILPIIPQGDGGDGGGGGITAPTGYGYRGPSVTIEDIEEGTITPEEERFAQGQALRGLAEKTLLGNLFFKAKDAVSDKARDIADKVRAEKAKQELAAQLAAAQEEINRMGYQDYGSGGGLDPSLNDPVTGEYTGASKQDYGSGE